MIEQEKTREIIDPTTKKKRNIRAAEVILHEEHDKNGKLKKNKYVKVLIVGKNREWDYFIPYDDFKEWNQEIDI